MHDDDDGPRRARAITPTTASSTCAQDRSGRQPQLAQLREPQRPPAPAAEFGPRGHPEWLSSASL
ncbi:hypothetical protein [Nonomuraea recticatena]|uniref:hypothetical protein n=1 Tax=Nonomuraea recticatena TaxID=46178 RepID=UPI00360E4448